MAACSLLLLAGCSILSTRPTQEMSDTAAAIRAAKEVQADTLAPEPFREAQEWFFKARHEYKFKNFKWAREYASKARAYAEQAEYEAIRGGAARSDASAADPYSTLPPPPPPAEGAPAFEPYDYPDPTGTPAVNFEKQGQEPQGDSAPAPAPESF